MLGLAAVTEAPRELAAASGAGESGDGAASSGLEPPRVVPFEDDRLGGKAAVGLFGSLHPTAWADAKVELAGALRRSTRADDPIHAWLSTFGTAFGAHAGNAVLAGGASVITPSMDTLYEPQLYEALIQSAVPLLDRCIRYRQQMASSENGGVRAGMGYLAFLEMVPLLRNSLMLSSSWDLADIQRKWQTDASHKYSQALHMEKQAMGMMLESQGNAVEAERAASKDFLRMDLLLKQFNISTEVQLADFTRYLSPGSAANYAEHYLRTLALLAEDLSDAYQKLYCAGLGIRQVLGLGSVPSSSGGTVDTEIPLFGPGSDLSAIAAWVGRQFAGPPDARSPDVLDALIYWSRAILRGLQKLSLRETEATISIPLAGPAGSKQDPLIPTAAIVSAFADGGPGYVDFELSPDYLPFQAGGVTLKGLRVVGVGVTAVHAVDDMVPVEYTASWSNGPQATMDSTAINYETPRFARLNAVIQTPPQTDAHGRSYSRPPVLLPNVRIQGSGSGDGEPALSGDPACRNVDPLSGKWRISIDPYSVVWFAPASPPKRNWLTGLILHLRVRAAVK